MFEYQSENGKLKLDCRDMGLSPEFLSNCNKRIEASFDLVRRLEAGEAVNISEGRRVGHYWLRAPLLAPTPEIAGEIGTEIERIKEFGAAMRDKLDLVVYIGMGGSVLGPQLLDDALEGNGPDFAFIDNCDPDGIERVLRKAEGKRTLYVVVSKSGSTAETAWSMDYVKDRTPDFFAKAICVTMPGSKLESAGPWLKAFYMWDFVGGRTSISSAVGLIVLALKGLDIDGFLKGAADCDAWGRNEDPLANPAMLCALGWLNQVWVKGNKALVVLPYKDSLGLFGKYLQQLIMESLGKEKTMSGDVINHWINVFGNKGCSDQHSFMQQVVASGSGAFLALIRVLGPRRGEVLDASVLSAFEALRERGRAAYLITVPEVDEYTLGMLIALFERTVSFYAGMLDINAYDQPAVELIKSIVRERRNNGISG